MSDDEDPFLADIEAYEEDQPYNYEPYSEIDIKKSPNTPENKLNQNQQDSVPKNQTLVIDLMSKMRKPDNPPSDSINQSSEIELPIFPALGNQSSILAEEGKEASKTTAPSKLKQLFPIRYFILKNLKHQHHKLFEDFGYGITGKQNEYPLKSAFEVCIFFS